MTRMQVANLQSQAPVNLKQMRRLADCAARRLKINEPGTFSITFIDSRRMRMLNKKFKRHDRPTDVLSFRYDGEAVVGDVLISPQQAKAYARENNIAYTEELSRYVVHGLLHWLGYKDGTRAEIRAMRRREDAVLRHCGVLAA